MGAVKSPSGSRCFAESFGEWRQGEAAVAVRVQRAAVGSRPPRGGGGMPVSSALRAAVFRMIVFSLLRSKEGT